MKRDWPSFSLGDDIIFKKLEYVEGGFSYVWRYGKVVEIVGGRLLLVELHNRTRVWADATECEPHFQHDWRDSEDNGGKYQYCFVCYETRERA